MYQRKDQQQGNRRYWSQIICLFLLGISVTIVSVSLEANEEEAPKGLGLFEIFDEEAPDDLSIDQFAMLDGNWTKWSEGVGNLVADLYEDDSLGVQGQREKIAHLKIKLNTMQTALNDPAYSAIFDQLIMLHGRLSRRIDFADAILDTLEMDSQVIAKQQLENAATNLRQVAGSTEASLNGYPNGSSWAPYLRIEKLKSCHANSKESVQAARNVQGKLANRNQLNDEQKEFLNRPFFDQLQQAINTFVAVANRQNKPVNKNLLRQHLANLVKVTEDFSDYGLTQDVANIAKSLKDLSVSAPDGGAKMHAVVDKYYSNNNFNLAIGEDLLNRLVGDSKTNRSDINDCFMGTRSIGSSDTQAYVSLDVLPNDDNAMIQLVLSGETKTNTTSYATQARARIGAVGNHRFTATRQLIFDGDQLLPLGNSASMNVNPSIQITGAGTKYDGIWILGSYARKKAYQSALAKRGESEQHAADSIRERVLPEFNEEVQNKVSTVNTDLSTGMNKRLKDLNLYPARKTYRSTDNQVLSTSYIAGENELGGGAPNYEPKSVSGATFSMHESLLNNTVNRMNLAGRTLTDEELRKEIESFFSQLTGSELTPSTKTNEDKKGPNKFVFAKQDPIRLQVDGGKLILILRCGFKQDGKKDIPQHVINVPLTFHLVDDLIEIRRGTVGVSAVNDKDNSGATARVIGRKISNSLNTRTRDRNIAIKREGRSDVMIRINKIKAHNGWLTIHVD